MHYYLEKMVEHRVDHAKRAQRNASFVRELRTLQRPNRRGLLATLVCRLTNWTPLELCVDMPPLGRQPYLESAAEAETSWRSSATSTEIDGRIATVSPIAATKAIVIARARASATTEVELEPRALERAIGTSR